MHAASTHANCVGNDIAQGFTHASCRVPLDIVDLVMEQLAFAGYFRALQQCSLTCKDFAEICQKHIFTDIALSNTPSYAQRNRTVPALTNFKKALDNKPYLEGYVRGLDYSHDHDRHSDFPPVFRHVQSLRLQMLLGRMSWSPHPSFKKSFLRFIRSNQITHFDLNSVCDFPTSIFAQIPRLEVLKMTDVTLHNDPPFVQVNPPKLRAFHCESSEENSVDDFIEARNRIVDLRALKHLEIDMGNSAATMRVMERLIQQSEALESLTFEGSRPRLDFNDNLARYLPDKSLKSLRSIELIIELWGIEDDPYLNLTSELEKLSGRNVLENLTFSITVTIYSTCNTETSRWSELDRVLSQPSAFPRLRHVQVAVGVNWFHESDRKYAMEARLAAICNEAFPRLKKNEGVRFDLSLDIFQTDSDEILHMTF